MELDGWPSIPTLWQFARCYSVDVGQLAALCGVLTCKIGRKTVFCDSRRAPGHIRMTDTARFSRKVLAAKGCYATAAEVIQRDRAAVHRCCQGCPSLRARWVSTRKVATVPAMLTARLAWRGKALTG